MKIFIKRWSLFFVLMFAGLKIFAQDHLYSQFFNSPIYLNPALNGQFDADFRANLIYRNQYTNVPGGLSYLTASFDYNVPRFGGGIGLIFTRSNEGTTYLNKNNIAAVYSYSVGSDDFVLSFGLQAGVSDLSVDQSKLVFATQIDPVLGYDPSLPSLAGSLPYNNKFYFDSGFGINLVAGQFMIGGALQHLNKPNESLSGTPYKLPIRSTAHLSYRWDLTQEDNIAEEDHIYVIPSVVYYSQSAAQSLAAGVQFKRKSVNVGLWYRNGGVSGPSALVVSLIFDLFINPEGKEKLRFGVSHDVPVSGLNYGNTSGSTEGSLGYETTNPARQNNDSRFTNATRCYNFY